MGLFKQADRPGTGNRQAIITCYKNTKPSAIRRAFLFIPQLVCPWEYGSYWRLGDQFIIR